MSLINQVLNELEKRGETAPAGASAIRPIPPRRKRNLLPYAAAALVALAAALAVWFAGREGTEAAPVPENLGQVQTSAPVAAEAAVEPQYQLVPGLVAASDVDAGMTVEPDEQQTSVAQPASRMTLELSSPPPQAAARTPAKQSETAGTLELVRKPPSRKPAAARADASSTSQPLSPLKRITPRQQAEIEAGKAAEAVQQGKPAEAIAGYESALRLDPLYHDARRALAGALLAVQRNADAERVLQDGLRLDTHESPFAMLLARLQVERGDVPLAMATLEQALPHADQQPEYHAFYAALLQRQNRHKEAITHFGIALQLAPGNGVWWMGYAISLQAVQRNEEARAAFRRALGTNSLNAELQAFVQKKLAELGG